MVLKGNITREKALARAEEAYKKFSDIMAGLPRRQKQIVEGAIKKIEKQQIEKLRKKLNLS
jgi:hypothetical protein